MMKTLCAKFLLVVMIITIVLGLLSTASAAWYDTYMDYAEAYGWIDDKEDPNKELTRIECLEILYRSDRNKDSYTSCLDWASQRGISDCTMLLNKVTREQCAVLMWRAYGSPIINYGIYTTDKDKISQWALNGVRWAFATNVCNGYIDDQTKHMVFNPKGYITKCQLCKMIFIQRYRN